MVLLQAVEQPAETWARAGTAPAGASRVRSRRLPHPTSPPAETSVGCVNGNRFLADVPLLPPRPRPRRAKTRSPSPPRSPPTSPPRWLRSPNLLAAGTSLEGSRPQTSHVARAASPDAPLLRPRGAPRAALDSLSGSAKELHHRRSLPAVRRARRLPPARRALSDDPFSRRARPPVPPQAVLDAAWLMLTGAAPAEADDDDLAVVGAGPGPQALRLSRRPLSRSASAPAEELFGWVRR